MSLMTIKLHVLGQISSYISTNKLILIMNAFFSQPFGYFPLVWMFHNRSLNNLVNKLKKRENRETEHPYNLQNYHTFRIYSAKTGQSRIWISRIWSLIPSNIKNCETLEKFKQKIKYWKPDNCPCRLCKTYIKGLGYE